MRNPLKSRLQAKSVITAAFVVALVVAMFLGTRFTSVTASALAQPAAFDAATFVQQKWPELLQAFQSKAVDITQLAPAVDADLAAAGKQYGQNLGAGSYAFPVKATGTVTAIDSSFITLNVTGMPANDVVRIPVGMTLNGLPLRDATGLIHFGDFTDQTDYQSVANALQAKARTDVVSKVDQSSLKGRKLTVYGGYSNIGPAHFFAVNPLIIEGAA